MKRFVSTVGIALWLCCSAGLSAPPAVEFQLVPSGRIPVNKIQDWVRAVSRLPGVQVRAETAGRATEPTVQRNERRVRVRAVISSRYELLVPGQRFALSQQSQLQDWVERLRAGETVENAKELDRFGLTTRQLKQVHEALKPAVVDATRGQNARVALLAIADRVPVDVSMSSSARESLARAQVDVELQGLSSGTAMAAILFPIELAFAPRMNDGKQLELVVSRQDEAGEAWPVGWKPAQPVRDVVPKFFEFQQFELSNVAIDQVLNALGPRLGTPILWDRPALQVLELDPAAIKVSLPLQKTFYQKVLDKALFQARLDYEVRVDEVGKPLLWIQPLIRR